MPIRLLIAALFSFILALLPAAGPQAAAPGQPSVPKRASGAVQILLELDDHPGVDVYAAERPKGEGHARGRAQAHVRKLDRAQRQLEPAIRRLGGKILYRAQRVYNGIAIALPAAQIDALQALPGVRALHAPVLHHPTFALAPWSIAAQQAWKYAGGATGRSVRIAIVDTGIDYTHRAFGGAGTTAAFTAARSDPALLEPGSGFPSAKVAGGIDLVGDNYDGEAINGLPDPVPDPDPIDCYNAYGHGTHVAGIAAGFGLREDGTLFEGPYGAGTSAIPMRIAPGVAPEALLYAVKVFGCGGATAMTPAGIEWAVDPNGDGDFADRMDVINLSLSSAFGTGYDASAVAADNAAKAGSVVVAAAGNAGDTYYIVGTPGTAGRAISVAAASGGTPASFSARGPRRGDSLLKPDIAAPGQSIFSANRGSGDGGRFLSGTSMAAPQVAGAAAILRQIRPDWSVEEIKAALMNTAEAPPSAYSMPFSPLRTGAGGLALDAAVRASTVAYSADEPGAVSVSFGAPEVIDTFAAVRHIRVVSTDANDRSVSYTVGVEPAQKLAGVVVTATLRAVTVQPGASATVPLLLEVDGSTLGRGRDATMFTQVGSQTRHALNEVTGLVTLTPDDPARPTLRIGYFAAPRRAGALRASAGVEPIHLGASGSTVQLRFHGRSAASPALVSVYELQHSSPQLTPSPVETGAVSTAGAAADLQYVGIASDHRRAGDVSGSAVSFGLATYAAWTTPSEVDAAIDIDSDRDGTWDYELSTDSGSASGAGDLFLTRVRRLPFGSYQTAGRLNYVDAAVDTSLYNSRVAGLGVQASLIGLSSTNTRFNYRVRTYHADRLDSSFKPVQVDGTPTLSYDITRPGFETVGAGALAAGVPLYEATAGATTSIPSDSVALDANGSQGLLLLQHNNIVEQQAQAVRTPGASPLVPRVYLGAIYNQLSD